MISIEPNPVCLSDLHRNIELNNLVNVTVLEKAIGERNGRITMYYDEERIENASAFKGSQTNSFETAIVTLDSISVRESSIKIVKIDTEGYDAKILEGARRTLQMTQYVLIEMDNEPTRNMLSNLGFSCERLRPSGYVLATRTSSTGRQDAHESR